MNTTSLTVDTSGEWLLAGSFCKEAITSQDGQGATGGTPENWTFTGPAAGAVALAVPAGAAKLFPGPFAPGQRIAKIATLAGSGTFTTQENP